MLLLTPVVSFPVAFAPTFTDSSLYLSYRQKRTVSFALRGLRGGFVADAQQHIFAAARQEASKPNLVSQKASVSTEFEIPPPAPGNGASVLVIGVAGGSGGGKSVFCKKLKSIVSSICPTVVLSHDSYYKDKPDVDRDCQGNWDCPEALHTAELVKHMIALKRGERVAVPHYDFAANARSPHGGTEQCFLPGTKGVMLVEGLMVLHDEGLRRIMQFNNLGPEGAGALAEALGRMTGMQTLALDANNLGPAGAKALLGALESMPGLTNLRLNDVDPRDVDLGVAVPEEKLREGWIAVLAYLRDLHTQGSVSVREVRLFLLGQGRQGKTSLARALRDPSGRAAPIAVEDRTVALDVFRGWRPGPPDSDVQVHVFDMGGQRDYRAAHSMFLSPRCISALLFSPEDSRTADQIVLEELLPWLHMVHTQSPGAHIFLACSRAESPPEHQPDPSAWRQHVELLAKAVEEKVPN